MLPELPHSLHLQKYEIFWNKSALQPKICKKEAKNLEVDEIMLTFATLDPIVPATRHTLGLVFYKVHP